MSNKDHADFLENLMTRRTEAVLDARNKAFPQEHANDTDSQLIQYLCACAKEIGHSPDVCEVIGGLYIARRFGGWQKALGRADLPKPNPAPKWSRRWIVLQERKRQRELFLEERKRARLQKRAEQPE